MGSRMRRYCSVHCRAACAVQLLTLLTAAAGCTSTSQQITGPDPLGKCSTSVAAPVSEFSPEGGEGRITVTTERDCRWAVQSNAAWVSIKSAAETQGSGAATFIVAPTSEPVPRTAALTVGDQQIAIRQRAAACKYQLSILQLSIPAAGGTGEIGVDASSDLCEWTVQADAEWLSIPSGRTHKGDGRVTVQATPWSGPIRRAEIALADHRVVVTQSDGCTYSITPSSANLPPSGGRGSVSVRAEEECGWSAASNVPWVQITSPATTAGPGVAEFNVDPNIGTARSGVLTIAGRAFEISQASGCEHRLDPAVGTFAAAGGPGTIAVSTPGECSWAADSEVDWIALTGGQSGTGPGVVQIEVSPNAGPPRSGGVKVGSQRFVATQSAGCTYVITPPTSTFSSLGGAGTITVTTEPACSWTATSQADWMTITGGASGVGPGIVSFIVTPNLFEAREGTMTIAGQTFVGQQVALGF
jgi:hypothetical protein